MHWKDAPTVYGPRKTLYNRFQRWAAKGVWTSLFYALATAGGPPAEVLIDSSAVKAHRCASDCWRTTRRGAHRLVCSEGAPMCLWRKRGERRQAIGRSRGGRTTKIHALTDRDCRPIAFLLTGGQVADCVAADTLLDQLTAAELVHGDKGYDTNAVRQKIEAKGAAPNIPPKINRLWKNCFSPYLYRSRNAIERMFNRLKDFRRVATRYDRLATNFHAAVCIAAVVSYWL
ncbi:IS5 family transposase [Acidisoma sp. 7E03]